MEVIVKCAGLALLAAVVCLLIKRSNPEMAFSVSSAAIAVLLLGTLGLAASLGDMVRSARNILGVSSTLIQPVIKCVGIAAVTRIASELCRDASQSAIAAAVEIAGTLCAAAVAMPLLLSMIEMIGGMV